MKRCSYMLDRSRRIPRPIPGPCQFIYGRLTNSTQEVLEKRLAALEGGSAALAVASGAAAISYTIEALAANGGHIVAQKTIYGGTFNLLGHTLPQYGIRTTFVNIHNLEEVEAAITDDTRAVFLETLGNPNSDIPDIDAVAEIAHRHGVPVVIDNTFGTPYLIRPIEHGAHEIHRRPRDDPWRHYCRIRKVQLGSFRQVSEHCHTESQLSWRIFL